LPAPAQAPAKRSAWPFILAFAVLGIAIGAALHVGRSQPTQQPQRDPGGSAAATGAASLSAAAVTSRAPAPSTAPTPSSTREDSDEIPPGVEVPDDYGLVDVVAPPAAHVRIDGAIAGAGPEVRLVAAPGFHEVRIEPEGQDPTKQVIEVRTGKTTRVRSAQAP
jgi:hypothetical protein